MRRPLLEKVWMITYLTGDGKEDNPWRQERVIWTEDGKELGIVTNTDDQ